MQADSLGSGATAAEAVHALVITPDAVLAETFRLWLELDDYRVSVCASDRSWPGLSQKDSPDVIFVDARGRPSRDLGGLRRLRAMEATRHTPAVIVSDHSADELATRGVSLGILDSVIVVGSRGADRHQWVADRCRRSGMITGRVVARTPQPDVLLAGAAVPSEPTGQHVASTRSDMLLEGERPDTKKLEEAIHWTGVYASLLTDMLRSVAAEPAQLATLKRHGERFERRLAFWKARSREISERYP